MGDRGVIRFAQGNEDIAAVYTHWRGSDADEFLGAFFAAEEANPQRDSRWDDPSYLAARFVAWAVTERGTGIGIVQATDTESSLWRVHCDTHATRPEIERL